MNGNALNKDAIEAFMRQSIRILIVCDGISTHKRYMHTTDLVSVVVVGGVNDKRATSVRLGCQPDPFAGVHGGADCQGVVGHERHHIRAW